MQLHHQWHAVFCCRPETLILSAAEALVFLSDPEKQYVVITFITVKQQAL